MKGVLGNRGGLFPNALMGVNQIVWKVQCRERYDLSEY